MRAVSVFAVLTITSACASSPSPKTEAVAPAAPAGPTIQHSYYSGSRTISLPDGNVVGGAEMLVHRVVDPDTKAIEEFVVDIDPERGVTEYHVLMSVEGNSFTMKEAGGAFEGKGTLTGPAWKWTGWSSVSTMPDGMTVESQDVVTDDKLVVNKVAKGADGAVQVTMVETLLPVSADDYEAARADALTAPTMVPSP